MIPKPIAKSAAPVRGALFLFAILAIAAPALAADVHVCFTPEYEGGRSCTNQIDDAIASARKQILVQAYDFTSKPIGSALVEAHRRGVDVRVILDAEQLRSKNYEVDYLARGGVPIAVDAKHNNAHNKVMIIDGETVITGSFNFTKAAERENAENVVFIRDAAIAREYIANFDRHAAHSYAYRSR
ncbi:MAG TPA: phospholipase D family protein [Candidatus Binataceae bacterium]|nr:phospholipase D family protein [Candidatus Binataceae bacterium]